MSGQNLCSRIRDVIRHAGRALEMAEITAYFPPKQPQPRPQTVAEFLAAGGRIQQLPPFAVSKPLRRIGMEAARAQ